MRKLKTMQVPEFRTLVRFHGALAYELQEEFRAAISTPFELIKLMEANRPGICQRWLEQGFFVFYLNGELVNKKAMYADLKPEDEIDVVPVIAGASILGIIAGVIAIVQAIFSLIQAFTKPPTEDLQNDATTFQNPGNVNTEGVIAPVIYGQTRYRPIKASENTFLGRSSSLDTEQGEVPFLTAEGVVSGFFGSKNFLPNNSGGGSPTLLDSETTTTQEIYILGEGEFDSLTDDDILFNGTAFATGGVKNFEDMRVQFLPGTDPQTLPSWIDVSAAPLSPAIDTKLSTTRVVRTLNADLDAARILFQTLSFFKRKKKEQVATSVQLVVEKRVTGTTEWEVVARPIISEKSFAEKRYEYTVNLDNTQQYDIAVSRVEDEVANEEQQDGVNLLNISEIQRDRVTYDGWAVLLVEYTNKTFGGDEPVVEVIPKGRKIKVPSNYDPVTRVYTGVWDGTYKASKAFTSNPPLCIQDTIEDSVFGLGAYLGSQFDRFNLFSLAQFSDVDVSDGAGGTEPRYTLNVALSERKKALATLRDLASVFRGQAIWNGSEMVFFTEQNVTASRLVNNERVVEGDFTYQGGSDQARPNSISVTFRDKNNRYEKSVVNFRNHSDIIENGLNETTFEGVGTTSAAQALRLAKYAAVTEGLVVRFEATEDWATILPGTVFALWDSAYMGVEDRSGLLSSGTASTTTVLALDRDFAMPVAETGVKVWVMMPDLTVEIRDVTNSAGSTLNSITVSSAFSTAPQAEAAWGVATDQLGPQFYVAQSRRTREDGLYEIDAIEFNADKFAAIEQDIAIPDDIPTTVPVEDSVPPPVNLDANVVQYSETNGVRNNIVITWERPSGDYAIVGYDVFISRDGGELELLKALNTSTTATKENAVPGEYAIFVRSVTTNGQSRFATKGITVNDGTEFIVGSVSGLELFNQQNDTEFVNRDAKFRWRYSSPITEDDFGSEQYGASSSFVDDFFKEFVVRIFDTSTGERVFLQEGIIQNEFTYTLELNTEAALAAGLSNPLRTFRIEVTARNKFNNESDPAVLVVSNPAAPLPLGLSVQGTIGGILISFTPIENLLDYAETWYWVSETSGFDPLTTEPTLKSPNNSVYIDIPDSAQGVTRYVRLAVVDTFGGTGLNISSEFEVTTTPVGIIDQEITFEGFVFTVTDPVANTISWTSGTALVRESESTTSYPIDAGSATLSVGQGIMYVYWQKGDTALSTTGDLTTVFASRDNRALAIYRGGNNLQQVENGDGFLFSGDQILAGTIGAAQLVANTAVITGSAQIANGIITNLKIGNIIQSNNYNPATHTGWQIDKNGVIRGQAVEIYDADGDLVFGTGTTINVNADGTITGFPSTGQVTLNGLGAGDFAFVDEINAANISTFIEAAVIGTAFIADGAVNNLKIGNIIQSNDWNEANGTGWQIDKNGTIKGRNIQILDESGALLFGSGTTLTVNPNGTLTGFGATGQVTLGGLGAGAFASISQLTAANISTYIASAAIGRALIGTAAIGSAQIGLLEVDNIHVKNRAITATTLKSKTGTQTLALSTAWQDVTSLVNTATIATSSEIVIHGTMQFLARVFDSTKFSVNVRLVVGGVEQSPVLFQVGGKGDMDINADPEDWYFSVGYAWKLNGAGVNRAYQIQVQIDEPSEGPVNFEYPQSLRIKSGSMIFMENFK